MLDLKTWCYMLGFVSRAATPTLGWVRYTKYRTHRHSTQTPLLLSTRCVKRSKNTMQSKISLLALGVIGGLVLLGGSSAQAKEVEDKKPEQEKATVIVVKSGDTLESIAKKHKLSYVDLYNANEAITHPDQIDIGDKIRIPKSDESLPDRFGSHQAQAVAQTATPVQQQTATTYTTQSFTSAPVNSSSYYVGNGMWCTDYVHSKRPDVAVYGNAGMNWISSAQAAGKSTGNTPKAGAVAVTNGHVAYVENVNSDGSYTVSEMGWNYQAGNYNKRTVKPGTFSGFIY